MHYFTLLSGSWRKKTAVRISDGGFFLERIMGIEPASTAWEAVVLPMNYIRIHLDVYFIKIIAKSQGEKQESGVLLNIIR